MNNSGLFQALSIFPRWRILAISLAAWQYVCVLGLSLLGWPAWLIWLNLILLAAFIAAAPPYESLLLLLLSLPFSVAVPNPWLDGLPMWRLLNLFLLVSWLAKSKNRRLEFFPWDRYLGAIAVLALVLAVFSRFPEEGIKQVLFWVNIYILYLVAISEAKGRVGELARYLFWSLLIVVILGFTQLIGTFFGDLDTFWVFWASNLSALYYGQGFSEVALFSNSWFSFSQGRQLRMFSVMPDSQSFAYVCLFAVSLATALIKDAAGLSRKWLWGAVFFSGWALVLSGTRAVWVGMIVPFAVVMVLAARSSVRLARHFLLPFAAVIIFFLAAPLINRGLALLQAGKIGEDFLSRAASIYDLRESSNRGRIAMWVDSAQYGLRHPWGTGPGNFLVSFSPDQTGSYEELASRLDERYNLPAEDVSAHSLYLQVFVELGLLGLALLAAFFFSIFKFFWKKLGLLGAYRESFPAAMLVWAGLATLWVAAAATFDITLLNDRVLSYFLLGLVVSGLAAPGPTAERS